SGKRQPISAAPTLLRVGNAVAVAFGTGKYLEASDTRDTQVQTFYALLDAGDNLEDGSSGAIIGKERLLQTRSQADGIHTDTLRWGKQSLWSSGIHAGWFHDFAADSERQVAGGVLNGGLLYFSSLIPVTATSDACSGGSANSYAVDVAQGTLSVGASRIGLLAMPLIVDIGEAAYSARDSVGQRTRTIRSQLLQQGSGGVSAETVLERTLVVGRLSWRQIPNYPQLHRKANP
ncbi:MAG: hypothetical protein QM617_15665, partial [Comamonas sp.]